MDAVSGPDAASGPEDRQPEDCGPASEASGSAAAAWEQMGTLQHAVSTIWPGSCSKADDQRRQEYEDVEASDSDDESSDDQSTNAVAGGNTNYRQRSLRHPEPQTAEAVLAAATAAASVAGPPPPVVHWRLSGDGLLAALSGQATTFVIEGLDATGCRRRNEGGDRFQISMSGPSGVPRVRVWDEGDGSYACEYRVTSTGKYRLTVMRGGQHLPGSPFAVSAKSGAGALKDWKATRSREAASLKAARKLKIQERKQSKVEPTSKRPTSPRIVVADQLQLAYALALEAVRSDKEQLERQAAGAAPETQTVDLGV